LLSEPGEGWEDGICTLRPSYDIDWAGEASHLPQNTQSTLRRSLQATRCTSNSSRPSRPSPLRPRSARQSALCTPTCSRRVALRNEAIGVNGGQISKMLKDQVWYLPPGSSPLDLTIPRTRDGFTCDVVADPSLRKRWVIDCH